MPRRLPIALLTLAAVLGALLYTHDTGLAGATITVNSTGSLNDGVCGTLPAEDCTLPEAITASGNGDTIAFDIPLTDAGCNAGTEVCTIEVTQQLPDIDGDNVTINGYTQPGASTNTLDVGNDADIKIEIDLESVPVNPTADGIAITGNNATVRGLAIYNVPDSTHAIDFGGGTSGGTVRGNYIGLRASGAVGPNNGDFIAVGVYMNQSTGNTIGGTSPAQRNVISGLDTALDILLGSHDSVVQGNYIGTNRAGNSAIPNNHGISMNNSDDVIIGGDADDIPARNVISGNTGTGISLGIDTVRAVIQGNYIGLRANGSAALGNATGVRVSFGQDALIGGIDRGNIISGNTTAVLIDFDGATTRIEGNRIGTNPAGTAAIGNAYGVSIENSLGVDIGGVNDPGQGNLISGNTVAGVYIDIGASGPADVQIAGNKIGTNLAGTAAIDNLEGIVILDGDDVVVGGDQNSARNIISGNTIDGVSIAADVDGTVVKRNYIGSNVSGFGALGQNLGIFDSGSHTEISLNLVSGNTIDGINLSGPDAVVQGNKIGVNPVLGALANGGNGILLSGDASGRIENVPAGPPNVIAHNGGDGIRLDDASPAVSVSINRNSIFSNGGLAIDFGPDGVTPNDVNDADTGANDRQNWPLLTSAHQGSTLVGGTLDSLPNRAYTLEVFAVTTCDPSLNGEGAVYGGSAVLNTDADGLIDFVVESSATAVVGSFVTATVTDTTTGNTSEFSNCIEVQAAPTPVPTPSTPTPVPSGPTPTPTATPIRIVTPPPSAELTEAPTPVPTITATVAPTATGGTETPDETGSPATTPTPDPSVSVTASPSPQPTGSDIRRQGDNDCSGAVVARDSLFVFLFLAQLTQHGFGDCPDVGTDIGFIWADVDCDDEVDADDGLKVLMWIAGFDVDQPVDCLEISEAFAS